MATLSYSVFITSEYSVTEEVEFKGILLLLFLILQTLLHHVNAPLSSKVSKQD